MATDAPTTATASDATPTSLAGTELAGGDIRVFEQLNSGAFATVYRGFCLSTQRTYALKFVHKLDPSSTKFNAQCDELDTHLRAHEHPGIVTLHRVIEHEEYIVYVLDLVDGGDLLDKISDYPEMYKGNDQRVRATFLQMIQAVKHAHDVGVYHRDLKLENFLVSEDLTRVYLADFGLATTSRVHERVGSLPYIPPGTCLTVVYTKQ